MMAENAVNQNHEKGHQRKHHNLQDCHTIHHLTEVGHDLQKILATQSLKNLLIWQLNLHGRIHQSREVGHDLQNMLATQGLENLLIWHLNLHRRIHQS